MEIGEIRCIYTSTHALKSQASASILHCFQYLASYLFSSTDAMRGPNARAFQQGFLKNLILSLQACRKACVSCSGSKSATMSLHERKRAIKSSADIAMATARGGGARWPRAILASSSMPCKSPEKVRRCKRIVRRCQLRTRRSRGGTGSGASLARTAAAAISSGEIARRLVRKRTKVLRKMIPGGELLDEISLLHEAMDYVAHLHAQVDVLRRISNAVR
ncbi:hypothetical protein SETIT_1G064600v2 [Setaria italica]|uniref:IBH1-like N-terminal domain-containing protein n=2 Tax=Setaria italica TaxID=4555 RepID=A0A368PHQ6_SETIT|nr:transcription factor IBH1-like 1 [Setaria italica]RCV05209.1 hypothetical protein SETIT_1G064600v2 [Setaria italica]